MRGRNSRRGLTLTEMLIVLVIVGILMAIGIVFLAEPGSNLKLRSTAGEIVSLLRNARAAAVAERAPTRVIIDTKGKTMRLLAGRQVAMWHFEDVNAGRTAGGYNNTGTVVKAVQTDGWTGRGLRLARDSSVNCGPLPSIAPDQGVLISIRLFREGEGTDQVVCSLGRGLAIAIRGTGVLAAVVGSRNLSSGNIVVPLRQWTDVLLVHDGRETRLCMNGTTVDWTIADSGNSVPWYNGGDSFVLGSTDKGFAAGKGFVGVLDEVKVAIIFSQDLFTINSDCDVVVDWEGLSRAGVLREARGMRGGATQDVRTSDTKGILAVHFDPQGRLDWTYHLTGGGRDFEFTLTAAGEEIPFKINPDGTAEKGDVRPKKTPEKKKP